MTAGKGSVGQAEKCAIRSSSSRYPDACESFVGALVVHQLLNPMSFLLRLDRTKKNYSPDQLCMFEMIPPPPFSCTPTSRAKSRFVSSDLYPKAAQSTFDMTGLLATWCHWGLP